MPVEHGPHRGLERLEVHRGLRGQHELGVVAGSYNDDGTLALNRDEYPRPGTTMESLAGLNPAFVKMGAVAPPNDKRTFDEICKAVYPQIKGVNHVHHAGNSSGVVDGASAVLLAS